MIVIYVFGNGELFYIKKEFIIFVMMIIIYFNILYIRCINDIFLLVFFNVAYLV